jgi:NitT/TauT family transport system permease protein
MDVEYSLSTRANLSIAIAGILCLFAIWCAVTYGGLVKPLFLPSPTALWEALVDFAERGWLVTAVLRSLFRVTAALLLVSLIGIPIGLVMGVFPSIDAFLRRPISGGKSIPVTGLVGLIILWFSVEESAKIIFLFLGSVFYMILLVRSAALDVNSEYASVAIDIGANRWQLLSRVILPGALPQIWDAIAVCNGLMWTYIVLAEFINSNEQQIGLGYLIYIGSRTQSSAKVFAALLLIAIISSLTDWFFQGIRQKLLRW